MTDPKSLFGQAFEELQFYPNALVSNCNPNGAFVVSHAPGDYTVCSPVWSIHTTGQKPNFLEPAAFNAMLTTGSSSAPLGKGRDPGRTGDRASLPPIRVAAQAASSLRFARSLPSTRAADLVRSRAG